MQLTSQSIDDVLYPQIEAHTTGLLEVSELHTIAWERSGNPDGYPAVSYTHLRLPTKRIVWISVVDVS